MLMRHETQLSVLHQNLKEISDGIGQIEYPVAQLDQLLKDLEDALELPGKINSDLKFIRETLVVLEDLAEAVEWMPEIGGAAKGVATVLKPLVKSPPPAGAIGEMRATLDDVDTVLKPVRNDLKKIKTPVDKTKGAIDKVHGKVNLVLVGVEDLMKRYGNQPPPGVEDCARQLNAGIAEIAEVFDDAKDDVVRKMQGFLTALGAVESEFHRIEGYIHTIQGIIDHLNSSAYRNAIAELDKLENKAKHMAKWIFKKIMGTLGINLVKLERFLNNIEGRIDAFVHQAIDTVLQRMKSALASQVERIPGVDGLEADVAKIEAALDQARTKFDDMLGSECAKVLGAAEA
jgi:ElaB/YqjD/DUF883 family membrane-anchored ribosome-binding protein